MFAINHALTGALIGLTVSNPAIALPLAVASHFACDAIPHFGIKSKDAITGNAFARLLFVDALLCVGLVAVLFANQSPNWFLASICAFAATSPDLMWIPEFIRARKKKKYVENRHILAFHAKIQWFQKPPGLLVEAAWAVGMFFLITPFVI